MAKSVDEIDLAALGRDAWARFIGVYQALQTSDPASLEQLDAAAFRAEMQRFQLWAINLGLYRQDHSSLDYRLRDNEVVRSFTEELFKSLIEALKEITSIIGHGDDESLALVSEVRGLDITRTEDEELSNICDGEGRLSSPIVMGILNDENESMLKLHFEDMTEAIDQLYNLASQIRSQRTRKYRTDIDLYKDVDDNIKSEYVSMRKRVELEGIKETLLQSRKLLVLSQTEETSLVLTEEDKCLIERLQKANHARRQQFEYWRRSKKQSIRAASKAMKPMPVAIHNDDGLKGDTPSLVHHSEVTQSVPSSVPALPKEFVLDHNRSTYTGTSRGLTLHGPSGEKVNWPKPPVARPRKEDFECPFCFYLCGPKYSEDAAWRSHLKHDLRPYVCTYIECTEPNVLYDSWEDWTRHEQWAHQQRVWRCPQHPQHEYVELASYEAHVKTYHTASMHHLLSSELLQSQESVSQVCDRPCPFCRREYERPIDLQHHVAGHLESTALLSLPNLENNEEGSEAEQVNSNSANRNYAESRAEDFDRMEPLAFVENDHQGHIPKMTEMEKELFRLKLEAEGVPFAYMNEGNVEARQAYSSDLAGEWLSRLPIELGEDVELQSETRSEPLSTVDLSSRIRNLLCSLNRLYSKVYEKCEDEEYAFLAAELYYPLQERLQETIKRSSQRRLSKMQTLSTFPILLKCEDIITHMIDTVSKYGSLQTGLDTIRFRLSSITAKLDVLDAYFAGEVDDEKLASKEDSESSGPSASVLEGLRAVDEPTTPTSVPISFSVTDPAEFSIPYGIDNTNNWLSKVFSQSSQISPTTLEEDSDGSSTCFGKHIPDAMAKLETGGNVSLAEFRFQNDQFIVRLYDGPYGHDPRILCCMKQASRHRKDSWESLLVLRISRRGSFLDLTLNDGVEDPPGLWACIKFPDYEGLVLFYCSFLALRSEGRYTPIFPVSDNQEIEENIRETISDNEIDNEREIFAARIVDDSLEHALHLFREGDTGVDRLQASVLNGKLKRTPVWTAFVTTQLRSLRWASRNSKRVVLADLEQFVFTGDYNPPKNSKNELELTFVETRDALDFMRCIDELRQTQRLE